MKNFLILSSIIALLAITASVCQNTNELVVCPAGTDAQCSLDIAQKWAENPEEPK